MCLSNAIKTEITFQVTLYLHDPNHAHFGFGGSSQITDPELGTLEVMTVGEVVKVTDSDGNTWPYTADFDTPFTTAIIEHLKLAKAQGLKPPEPKKVVITEEQRLEYKRREEERKLKEVEELERRFKQEEADKESDLRLANDLCNMMIAISNTPAYLDYYPPTGPQAKLCWIAPDGRVWSCNRNEHIALAEAIIKELYTDAKRDMFTNGERFLETEGWIKHNSADWGHGEHFFSYTGKTTKDQRNACFDIYKAYEVLGKQKIADELYSDWKCMEEES